MTKPAGGSVKGTARTPPLFSTANSAGGDVAARGPCQKTSFNRSPSLRNIEATVEYAARGCSRLVLNAISTS